MTRLQAVVTLDEYELAHASMAGCQRRIASIVKGRPQRYGAEERNNHWQIDIVGMIAEYAVAKAFNQHWQPATNKRLSDLPGDVGLIQIRSTEHLDGHLFLHPQDKEAPYLLTVVRHNRVLIAGWITKTAGMKTGVLKSKDTYWVAQENLWSLADYHEPIVWSDTVQARFDPPDQ